MSYDVVLAYARYVNITLCDLYLNIYYNYVHWIPAYFKTQVLFSIELRRNIFTYFISSNITTAKFSLALHATPLARSFRPHACTWRVLIIFPIRSLHSTIIKIFNGFYDLLWYVYSVVVF